MIRTEQELRRLLITAQTLGYWDDVVHWQNELEKLQESLNGTQES